MASKMRSSLGFDFESRGFPVLGFQHQLYPQANSLSDHTQTIRTEQLTRNIAIRNVESLGSEPKTAIFKMRSESAELAGWRGVPEKERTMSEIEICPTCGGPMCPHDICSANWCGQDYECPDCADREWREIKAEDEARYWSHSGWKEVFEDQ